MLKFHVIFDLIPVSKFLQRLLFISYFK